MFKWNLFYTCEQVNVVHVVVGPPEPLNDGERDLATEVAEVVGASQVADGPGKNYVR